MKGFRSFVVWLIIGLLGLVTALESIDVKSILLPLVCQVDPSTAEVPSAEASDCVSKVIKYVGYWTMGLASAGIALRAITSSAIFSSFRD